MPHAPHSKTSIVHWLDANLASLKRLGFTRAECYALPAYIFIRPHFRRGISGDTLFPLFRRDIERAIPPAKFDRIINQLTVYLIEHPATHLASPLRTSPKG